jgi:hypothetical protein
MSRVGGEVGTKGRVVLPGGGTGPVPQVGDSSPLAMAVAQLVPQRYSESDIEQLVQTITDQIMAAAGDVCTAC